MSADSVGVPSLTSAVVHHFLPSTTVASNRDAWRRCKTETLLSVSCKSVRVRLPACRRAVGGSLVWQRCQRCHVFCLQWSRRECNLELMLYPCPSLPALFFENEQHRKALMPCENALKHNRWMPLQHRGVLYVS